MRVHKTKKVTKIVDEVVESYEVCDKCGGVIDSKNYDAYEFDLEIKTGDCYPGSGSGQLAIVDLCQDCKDGFVLLLKNNGYKVNYENWNY